MQIFLLQVQQQHTKPNCSFKFILCSAKNNNIPEKIAPLHSVFVSILSLRIAIWFKSELAALQAMGRRFNPFPDTKKGKGKGSSIMKRPAKATSPLWKDVKDARDKAAVPPERQDRAHWKRSLPQLLCARNSTWVKWLRDDGILYRWENKMCPRCRQGCPSKLQPMAVKVCQDIDATAKVARLTSTHTICTLCSQIHHVPAATVSHPTSTSQPRVPSSHSSASARQPQSD